MTSSISKAPLYVIPKYVPARSSNNQKQKIPRKIFQTWKSLTVSKEMFNAVSSVIEMNPDYEYYFFDNTDCRNFIEKHFNSSVLRAYDNLIPGAFKADLWRYCVLYIHGGVYMDIKTVMLKPLSELIKSDINGLICLDRPDNWLLNGLMFFVAENGYILKCLEETVKNCLDAVYDKEGWQTWTKFGQYGSYCISGPILCGNLFLKYVNVKKIESKIYQITVDKKIEKYDMQLRWNYNDGNNLRYQNDVVMHRNYNGYYEKESIDNYRVMFRDKLVFKTKSKDI